MKLSSELAPCQPTRHEPVLECDLRSAVDACQFELHYQPIVNLHTLGVHGVEALLRWQAPGGSFVTPSQFVPLAEATGLIHPLGLWSLHEACRQAVAWRRAGLGTIPISVNLSPCQVNEDDIVESILSTLEATHTDPGMIELEITETSLMQDIDLALPKLRRLCKAGIRLAIDDFGTGYSSLSYLRQLPIAKIKLDQSFVRDLQINPSDVTIVRAIINLAKQLGLTTVAEGVETAGQLQVLQSLGCDHCQGFYFSRPAPAVMLTPLLATTTSGERPAWRPQWPCHPQHLLHTIPATL